MPQIDVDVLETSFRGHARKSPWTWGLHYRIVFACKTPGVPLFYADQIEGVMGFFQLRQPYELGLWGQFERVDISREMEFVLGPRPVWRAKAEVEVRRERPLDAWARVKLVFLFRKLMSPGWFKTNAAFRADYVEDLSKRWGDGLDRRDAVESTFCYSGSASTYSVEAK